MIRYRILFLFIFLANFLNVITEDALNAEDKKIDNPKPPDKTTLRKSTSYSQNTITGWLNNPSEEKSDLTVSAAEYVGARYLPPPSNNRGYARSCYECNSVPWIPVAGRSLRFSPSSHSNSLEETSHYNSRPYFKEKNPHVNIKPPNLYHPPIDQYGAPQGSFHFPPVGEVVEFMLPPPYKSGNIGLPNTNYGSPKPRPHQYGTPQTIYGSPKPSFSNDQNVLNLGPPPLHQKLPPPIYKSTSNFKPPSSINYGIPSSDILSPPPLRYGAPPSPTPSRNYDIPLTLPPTNGYGKYFPTTHLRPVSQDFQPPLAGGGIHTLPLENNLPPPAPSDSYGRPITDTDSYGVPTASGQHSYLEPITLGSGDSEEYGKQIAFNSPNHFLNFESQQSAEIKGSLYEKGLTDVQVVPSVRIADYTASIEHPINLIQSPILDLHVKESGISDVRPLVQQVTSYDKLSEKPIVVDDTYTSASNINTTYSADDNATPAIKRHNDKFLSSETFSSNENKLQEADLTNNFIQKLIFEHNIIEDPKTEIVGIEKTTIDPKKVRMNLNLVQPSVDYSSWTSVGQSTIPSMMVPPKPSFSTWLTPVNESYVTAKQSKKLQIIVPYLRTPNNDVNWNNQPPSTAIYNREYTTLAPVFVPPPMTTEVSNLWTQFVEGIRTVESHKEQAHGFAKPASTTEVYNIKDFLSKKPYDIISLQKNIDDWTHQAYSNRHNLEGKLTTKLAHVKEIPEEYFTTTPSYNAIFEGHSGIPKDHVASGSHKKEFVSQEIRDNLIVREEETSTSSTTASNVKFIVRQPKPSWEENKVTLSNSTHEKVYVVTPQSYTQFFTSTPPTAFSMAPRIQNGKVNNVPTMTKISVRVEAPSEKGIGRELKPVKVVYSEWPHLINNLITTTTTRPTTRHPLFGLMDLAPYTVPPNSTVETIGGHSKVTNAATSSILTVSNTTPMPTTTSLSGTVKVSPVP